MNERTVPVILFPPISFVHLHQFASQLSTATRGHYQSSPCGRRHSRAPSQPLYQPDIHRHSQDSRAKMPLKNTIAFERRLDLASLFCMIGRHGPAVVMAVLGMACLLAGFIIYRTVRERWRRRTAEPNDRDSHAGHRGAALGLSEEEEPSAGEARTCTGSTDTSESSSSDDQEEDRYLSHRPPNIRHRRAAAETQSYKETSPPEKAFVWDLNSHKTKDVTEEVCGTKESGENNAVRCEEEEKVFEAEECDVVSEEECRQVEQRVQFTFSNPPNLIIEEKENNTLEAKSQEPISEKLEDINIIAPHFENETIEIDQCQHAEQSDHNIVAHPTDEKATDQEPSNLLQDDSKDSNTSNNVNVETLNVAGRIDLPFSCQKQSEPPRLDEEIDQNGLCTRKPLHHETHQQNAETRIDLKIPCSAALVDPANQYFEQFELKDNSVSSSLESGISSMTVSPDVEEISTIVQDQTDKLVDQDNDISGSGFTVSYPSDNVLIIQNAELELNKAEAETIDHQKVDEKVDIKPSTIKQDAFIKYEETAQANQAADQDSLLSNLKDNIEEELPDLTHNIPQDEVNSIAEVGQSSNGASSFPPKLDVETVCLTPLLCHTTEPETVSGQKDIEVDITEDQQTTIKTEIQEQNPSLQPLQVDLLQLKGSHDNFKSESIEEGTEENPGSVEESVVHIKEDILIVTSCPDQTLNDTSLPDTKSSETYMDTNTDISKKTEAGDLNVCQAVTSDTFEASDLEASSCPTIGVFESPSTFPDLAITAEESIAQTRAQNSANACSDLVKVENEKENLSGIETEIEMVPKEHDLDTNNTHVENQNGCQVKTFEGSTVQVPTQIETVSSSQTVKAFNNSCTQDMVITEGTDAQLSATDIVTDTSLEPRDLNNEVTEKCLSGFKSEIVDIKDFHMSTLNECEIVSKEHETPLDSNHDIPTQNGCKKVIDTFEVSAVVSEPSCQTNDSGVSSVMTASSENTYSFREQKFEYQHDESEVSDKLPVRAGESTSNIAIPPAELEPDMSSNQELRKDHAKMNNMELGIPSSSAPVDLSNLSLEQSELKDIGMSSADLESEISSITVGPDVEEVIEEISAVAKPKCDHMVVSHDSAEFGYLHSLCAPDVVVTNEEEAVTVVTGPTESGPIELSPPEDISYESLVTNEQPFGSEIEDRYQKAMEELMAQVADNINVVSEVKKQTNVNKKEKVCAVNQGEEKLKAEFEKNEISIMEATMDHNEWITEGNYQVLPWMNAPLFVKNNSKEPEIPQVVENKLEENTENAKKVLAVQPMPQNVNVTFRVHYLTLSPYQTVAVTGDQQELGSWKSVIPLQKAKDGYWSCVVSLPVESNVEWKFVVLDKGEVCRWEECGNRLLYTGYGDDLLVHKWWGSL